MQNHALKTLSLAIAFTLALQGCGGGAAGGSNSDVNAETLLVDAGENQAVTSDSVVSVFGKAFSEKDMIASMQWVIRQNPSNTSVTAKLVSDDTTGTPGLCAFTPGASTSGTGVWKDTKECAAKLSISPSPVNQDVVLTLIATDTKGHTRSDDVSISIASGIASLSVDAGPDLNVMASSSVSIPCHYRGGFWFDKANPKPVYRWYIKNAADIQLTGASLTMSWDTETGQLDMTAPASLPKNTDAQMTCEVTDESGAVSEDTTVFHLSTLPPLIATAGASQTVAPDNTVTLDASGSTDPAGGTSMYYQWAQISGQPVTITDRNNAKSTFISPHLPTTGNLVFEVVASRLPITPTSVFATTERAQTVVRVQGDDETGALIVDAGVAQSVVTDSAVKLVATVTDLTSPAGGTYHYLWEQVSGQQVVIANGNTGAASFVAPSFSADLSFRVSVSRNPIMSGTTFATTEQALTSVIVRSAQ